MKKAFEIISRETGYAGFFRLEKYRLRHTLFAGGWSGEIERELFGRGKCVAVLLYDPERDEVVLIEQFRIGAIGCPERAWLVEIVAGAIEDGETAEEVAHREAEEEAGCEIGELLRVMHFYTTPGGYAEMITLFCGRVDASQVGGVHGLDHEGEDILVRAVPFSEAYGMIESGEIESAIPILALQWLALNRGQLLRKWAGKHVETEK
jgi:ADP-ribose pyrophosphatase